VGDPATVVSAPAGEGKIQILPSVRTPSTSKRMSLILRARAVADGLGIAAILAGRTRVGTAALGCPAERSSAAVWATAGFCFSCVLLYSHINMCNNVHMATNLALDDRLIEEARRAGKH